MKAKAVPNAKPTWEGDSSWLAPKHVDSFAQWEKLAFNFPDKLTSRSNSL